MSDTMIGGRKVNNINTVLGALGSDPTYLIIDTEQILSADLAFPSTCYLAFRESGKINTNGNTLTISSPAHIIASPNQQIFTGTGTVSFTNPGEISSLWFDADPWDSLDKAVSALEASKGGTVLVQPTVYDADKAITVSCNYPINLISNMQIKVPTWLGTAYTQGYIRPRTGIAGGSLIEYVAPDVANRYRHGAGLIRGLLFLDDSDLANATIESRRVVAVEAALKLTDFDHGRVENCGFHYIKGSAIKVDRAVKGNIKDFAIEYCGDTSQPSLWLNPQSSSNIPQSMVIELGKIEHCFNDDYLAIDADCERIKILAIGFESGNTDPANASCQIYIDSDGNETKMIGCHFNKNGALHLNISGNGNQLDNCSFSGDNTNGRITWSGVYGTLSNLVLRGASSNIGTQITVSGGYSQLNDINVVNGGNMVLSGLYINASNIMLYNLDTTETHALKIAQEDITVSSATIMDTNNDVGGVQISDNYSSLVNSKIRNIGADAGNTANGVDTTVGEVTVRGNDILTIRGTGVPIVISHTTNIVEANNGFITKARGLATIAGANTSVVVTHGMNVTPTDIQCTFQTAPTNATSIFVTSIGATTFTININAAPGGADEDYILWRAERVVN